jgi:glycosyltransferase involved in cell wall biosynthesis
MKKLLIVTNKEIPSTDYRVSLGDIDGLQTTFVLPDSTLTYKNIEVIKVPLFGGFSFRKEIVGLTKLFRVLLHNKYDITHFYNTKYYLIGPLLAFLSNNKNIIITINGFGRVFSSKSKKYLLVKPIFIIMLNISSLLSNKITVQNSDDFKFLKRILLITFHKKINLVYSASRLPEQINKKIINDNFNVLHVARIMKDKGIKEFLSIARETKKRNMRINFTLIGASAGDKVLDNEVERAVSDGILNYFEYTNNMSNYYVDTDLILFTSYREGMPRVVLEAMSYGIPVFAYDTVGLRDVVKNDYNGKLFTLYDVNNIATEIVEISKDINKMKSFQDNALKLFNKDFTFDSYRKRIKEIYFDLNNITRS